MCETESVQIEFNAQFLLYETCRLRYHGVDCNDSFKNFVFGTTYWKVHKTLLLLYKTMQSIDHLNLNKPEKGKRLEKK